MQRYLNRRATTVHFNIQRRIKWFGKKTSTKRYEYCRLGRTDVLSVHDISMYGREMCEEIAKIRFLRTRSLFANNVLLFFSLSSNLARRRSAAELGRTPRL